MDCGREVVYEQDGFVRRSRAGISEKHHKFWTPQDESLAAQTTPSSSKAGEAKVPFLSEALTAAYAAHNVHQICAETHHV